MRTFAFDCRSVARSARAFVDELRAALGAGGRVLTLYARPGDSDDDVVLTAVTELAGEVAVLRASLARSSGFHSMTREFPALHIFEREIFEQYGVKPHDHPWLKPVRFSDDHLGRVGEYPFFKIEGKEVHEVGVGPIHAGVIEPGHFRFMCLGETVHHLEVQLGFQHRGVERLLLARPPWTLGPLVETIAGDTSVAHAWAYSSAIEALSGIDVPGVVPLSRGIALELERIAMHLAGLSGMAADIAFLQGAATYGRLRTTVINTTMLLCGSRFGRGWVRPHASRATMNDETAKLVGDNLALVRRDVAIVNRHFSKAITVGHRLKGVGVLATAEAALLGIVGMAARASGVALDARRAHGRAAPYDTLTPEVIVEAAGDCWARTVVRIREIDESLRWLVTAMETCRSMEHRGAEVRALRPETLAVSVCEGWRGEVVHCVETTAAGLLRHYRVQDPSLRNWFGLALAMRENDIYDFPICNKSFDLSYCGNDL